MRSRVKLALVAVSAAALVATFNVTAVSAPELDPETQALVDDIDQILADTRLDGSQAAVLVADADTGDILYDVNSGDRLLPASNTKMFTAAAALDGLGPDFTWTTTVETTAQLRGSNLRGDLYLRGGGDATMLEEDLRSLAEQVAAAGVKNVAGDLVADDSYFDNVRLGRFWSWDDQPFYYSAQTSGLTLAPDTDYDSGTVFVEINAGENVGDPGVITITPETDYVNVINETVTTEPGTGRSLGVARPHGTNDLIFTGTIAPDGGTGTAWRAVWEPTGYAADVFARLLDESGVKVKGDVRVGTTPADATVLASHDSMTLAEMLIPFMKLSNNMHAEALVKTLGREVSGVGSWAAGQAVVDARLADLGVDVASRRQVDGSGLSRGNFITAASIAELLDGVQDQPWFDEFYESMPVAGVQERLIGGTLRNRMGGTPAADNVRAKTGTLTGATALSGYVTTAADQDLIFAVVFNNHLSAKPSDLEDAIAVRLASHGGDVDSGPSVSTLTTPDSADLPAGADELIGDVECSWVKAC
jgi:serine-type D-Ala-D-Ala carboxypeptidase/endopeptidase (penicillin-binding protein 4)